MFDFLGQSKVHPGHVELHRIRWRVVEIQANFSIGGIQFFAEAARAEPEAVTKMELRRVTAARVGHCKNKKIVIVEESNRMMSSLLE